MAAHAAPPGVGGEGIGYRNQPERESEFLELYVAMGTGAAESGASISAFVALRRAEEVYLHLSVDDIDDRRASVPFAFQSVAAPAICAGVWALHFVILTDFSTETASR